MELKRSPLAPDALPTLPPVEGVRVAGDAVGLKKTGAKDLFVALLDPGSVIAGTLTRSRCASAPVDWCRQHLPAGNVRAIVVNSGNANAFTGNAGDTVVAHTVAAAAETAGCGEGEVFVASTGVIGVPVPPSHIADAVPGLAGRVAPEAWDDAAAAIMTTDTFAKMATRQVAIGDRTVTINGIAKGSGMVAPDMATMLAFIFTDAAISLPVLQEMTRRCVDASFNSITVDSDTSTSDTVLVVATGRAGNEDVIAADAPHAAAFTDALGDLMIDLAKQIVCDGEGAQKLITITVTGAESDYSARRIGLSIGNSPLVKTAIAGGDANWGRIVMAVGKAGEPADRDRLSIGIGGVEITRDGQLVPDYDETPVAAHVRQRHVSIDVDLGIGKGAATVWTCDLTHGYIEINADYRS